jgi:hypothetical protein
MLTLKRRHDEARHRKGVVAGFAHLHEGVFAPAVALIHPKAMPVITDEDRDRIFRARLIQ